jgi:hypothetical protein
MSVNSILSPTDSKFLFYKRFTALVYYIGV